MINAQALHLEVIMRIFPSHGAGGRTFTHGNHFAPKCCHICSIDGLETRKSGSMEGTMDDQREIIDRKSKGAWNVTLK